MATSTPFDFRSPLTGRTWSFPHPSPELGTAGAFPRGMCGAHSGIHLRGNSQKPTPIFCPCSAKVLYAANGDLALELEINWPLPPTPRIWSIFSGLAVWKSAQHFQAGECLGHFLHEVHWEIFLEQSPAQAFPNPLQKIHANLNWNFPPIESYQDLFEFAGTTALSERDLENFCLQNHLQLRNEKELYDKSRAQHNWWSQITAKYALPPPAKLYHVHPWRLLETLEIAGKSLPQFTNQCFLDAKDWRDFFQLCGQTTTELSPTEMSVEVWRTMFQMHINRSFTKPWKDTPLKNPNYLAQDLFPKWNAPAQNWLFLLQDFLIQKAQTPLVVLALPHSQKMPPSHWNLKALRQCNLKEDSAQPWHKSTGNFDFYAVDGPDHPSPFEPLLSWKILPDQIYPGEKLLLEVELVYSSNFNFSLIDCHWEIKAKSNWKFESSGSPHCEVIIPLQLQPDFLRIQFSLQLPQSRMQISRKVEVLPIRQAQISQSQSLLKFSIPPQTYLCPINPLTIAELAHGNYDRTGPDKFQLDIFHYLYISSIPTNHQSLVVNDNFYQLFKRSKIQRVQILANFPKNHPNSPPQSNRSNPHTPSSANSPPPSPILSNDPHMRMLQLGYWMDAGFEKHAWITFQAEFGLPRTGVPDTATLQRLKVCTQRPGFPVHKTIEQNKKFYELNTHFYQLPCPTKPYYKRYGDMCASASDPEHQELIGIRHNEAWGTLHLIHALLELSQQWYHKSGQTLELGDLSLWCGGKLKPHVSHQKGTSIDCRTKRIGAYVIAQKDNPHYSAEETIEFCQLAHSFGFGPIYTTCNKVLKAIGPQSDKPIVTFAKKHHHHLHMEHRGP